MRASIIAGLLLAASTARAQTNIEVTAVRAPADALAGTEIEVAFDVDLAATFAVDDVGWEVFLTPGVDLDAGVSVARGTIATLAGPRTVNADVTLATDQLGRWRVAVRVDPADRVSESNEFDNVAFTDGVLRVREPRPDFVVDQVSASESEVSPGDPISVSARVRNLGSVAGTATAQAVLSSGALPSSDDPALGTAAISLAPGESTSVQIDGTTPAVLAGDYRPGLRLDVDQADANPADDLDAAPTEVTIVKDSLQLLTSELVAGVVNLEYFARFVADGGDGDYAFARVSGSLPTGLRIQDGAIVGTPRESGSFTFALEVTSRGLSDVSSFDLEILQTDEVLIVVTSTLPEARLGLEYGHLLVAGGGEPPYDWEVIDGALPPGLALDGELLAGVPDAVGSFDLRVEVTDRLGATASRSFRIDVSTSNTVLVDPEPLPVAAAGVRYEAQLSATGGVPPYRWRALSELPVGLTLASSGRVTGTPGRPGAFVFRVEVTDSTDRGIFDRSLVFLDVEDAENFSIVRPEIRALRFGNRFELVFDVEGGVRPYTWSLAPGSRLPRNTFFVNGEGDQAERGVLFGAPSELGTFGLGVLVEDGQGRTRSVEVALRVEQAAAGGDGGGGCRCAGATGGGLGLAWLIVGSLLALPLARRRAASRIRG